MLVKKLTQTGDTIVEVMIVLAVLGSAIGLSYATANRSLLNARQAQENAEAARLAQSQIESLYTPSSITDPANANYLYKNSPAVTFCMNGSGNKVTGFPAASEAVNQRDLAYSGNVADTATDGDFPVGCHQGLYHYSIRYDRDDNDKFTIVVVWDDALGQGRDTVTLTYRIHPQVQRNDI